VSIETGMKGVPFKAVPAQAVLPYSFPSRLPSRLLQFQSHTLHLLVEVSVANQAAETREKYITSLNCFAVRSVPQSVGLHKCPLPLHGVRVGGCSHAP